MLGSLSVYYLSFHTSLFHTFRLLICNKYFLTAEKINELNVDLGLELHFNGFSDSSVSGAETLHAGTKKGSKLAECIQYHLVNSLGRKDRGIKTGHYRQNIRRPIIDMLRLTNCPFVVPEPGFLTNKEDLNVIADYEEVADSIFCGIDRFCRQVL